MGQDLIDQLIPVASTRVKLRRNGKLNEPKPSSCSTLYAFKDRNILIPSSQSQPQPNSHHNPHNTSTMPPKIAKKRGRTPESDESGRDDGGKSSAKKSKTKASKPEEQFWAVSATYFHSPLRSPCDVQVANQALPQLSKNRRITVNEYNKKTMINIREYYDADGEMKPSKKVSPPSPHLHNHPQHKLTINSTGHFPLHRALQGTPQGHPRYQRGAGETRPRSRRLRCRGETHQREEGQGEHQEGEEGPEEGEYRSYQ